MDEQLVIIGGNTAGLAAALAARRRCPDLRILVLEASSEISWGACGLPYNLADPAREPEDLRVRPASHFQELGVTLALEHRVLGVDPLRRRLRVERRTRAGTERLELAWERLVVASGARPRELVVPGLSPSRLTTFKTLDDLRSWRDRLPGLRRVLVAGAGPLGLELCEALRARGLELLLLDPASLPLPGWPLELRQAVAEELAAQGVRFLPGTRIRRAREESAGCLLELESGEEAGPVDLVVNCTGNLPATDFLPEGWPRGERGALSSGSGLRLGDLPVWAAGDCACRDCAVPALPGEDRQVWNPQARDALNAGRVAGWNAALGDEEQRLAPALLTQVLRCFNLELARCGRLSEASASPAPELRAETPLRGLLGQSMSGSGLGRSSRAEPRRSHARGGTLGHALPNPGRLEVWLEADAGGRLRGGAILSQGPGGALRINALAALLQQGGLARDLAALDLAYSPPFGPLADPLLRAAERLQPA